MSQFDPAPSPEQNQTGNVSFTAQPPVQYVYLRAGRPTLSLFLGIFGLTAWIAPVLGLPVTIVGIIYGKPDIYGGGRVMARIGTILCIIGLCLTLVNMALGAYLGATGQHPLLFNYNPQ